MSSCGCDFSPRGSKYKRQSQIRLIVIPVLVILSILIIYKLSPSRQFKKSSEKFEIMASPEDFAVLKDIKDRVCKLHPRIKDLTFKVANASETVDKTAVYMCLKDENGKYYDMNTLTYVAIHEMAHVLTDIVDPKHVSPEFLNTFFYLQKKGEALGIYDPKIKLPNVYCDVHLG